MEGTGWDSVIGNFFSECTQSSQTLLLTAVLHQQHKETDAFYQRCGKTVKRLFINRAEDIAVADERTLVFTGCEEKSALGFLVLTYRAELLSEGNWVSSRANG